MTPGPDHTLLAPGPGMAAGRAAAAAAGWNLIAAPLLRIEPVQADQPAGLFDALLLTSPQTPRHLDFLGGPLRRLPAYAVGQATAAAARAAGLDVAAVGTSDGSAIVAVAAAHGRRRLLHPGGTDRAAIDIPAGIDVLRLDVYRAVAVPALDPGIAEKLQRHAIYATLLSSPRTAQLFARLVAAAGMERAELRLIALSTKIAAAAGQGWKAVAIARSPALDAALAAADRLWQRDAHG